MGQRIPLGRCELFTLTPKIWRRMAGLTKRVTEEDKQGWSSDDMRGAVDDALKWMLYLMFSLS